MERHSYELKLSNDAEEYKDRRNYRIDIPADPDHETLCLMSEWLEAIKKQALVERYGLDKEVSQ